MNDLIERLAAIKTIDEMLSLLPYDPLKSDYTQGITIGLSLAESRIKRLPSEQPERAMGKWIDTDNYYQRWKCSVCGCHTRDAKPPYCPNCGAKMEDQ